MEVAALCPGTIAKQSATSVLQKSLKGDYVVLSPTIPCKAR